MESQKKTKFNILDFTVLIVVVAVAVVAIWLVTSNSSSSANTQEIKYLIEINNVNPKVKDSPRVGDTVIDGVTKNVIGVIEEVKVYPQTFGVYNSLASEMITVENPLKFRVELWCSAKAEVTDTSVSVDGYELSVGKAVFVHSKHFAGEGYCLSITRGEEGQN